MMLSKRNACLPILRADGNFPKLPVFAGRANICLGSPYLSIEGRSYLDAERSVLVTESAISVIAARQFQLMSGCADSCAAHGRSSSPPGSAGRGQAAQTLSPMVIFADIRPAMTCFRSLGDQAQAAIARRLRSDAYAASCFASALFPASDWASTATCASAASTGISVSGSSGVSLSAAALLAASTVATPPRAV